VTATSYVGLPGFHGSATLFEPMVAACPARSSFLPLALPNAEPASYVELEQHVAEQLPPGRPWLIAESFSGPLAVRLAARGLAAGLVLSASFVRSPMPRATRGLPLNALGGLRPPRAAIRWALTGGDDDLAGIVIREVARLPRAVLSHRFRELQSVDVSRQLLQVACPILYLQATRDRLVPPRCGREVQSLRPSAALTRLDAPHLVLQSSAREAWTAIARFVEEQGQPPP